MAISFHATLEIIGINPYITIPDLCLRKIFEQAGKDKGPIPVKGTINKKPFQQTLVRYRGAWRLYINTEMLTQSPKRIGESIAATITYDPTDRSIKPHPKLVKALTANPEAKAIFQQLTPSLRKEIIRYISFLKTPQSIDRNVQRAIQFLLGKERFIGRNLPR